MNQTDSQLKDEIDYYQKQCFDKCNEQIKKTFNEFYEKTDLGIKSYVSKSIEIQNMVKEKEEFDKKYKEYEISREQLNKEREEFDKKYKEYEINRDKLNKEREEFSKLYFDVKAKLHKIAKKIRVELTELLNK